MWNHKAGIHVRSREAIECYDQGFYGRTWGSADWAGAIPENSAVGESQSNGKAEAAVKCFEDQLRVMKGALESRLGARVPSHQPAMKWLVEYVAVVLNKYAIQSTGRTAYHDLHGKKVSERLAEFGEVILHYIPKKSAISWTCVGPPESTWERP